MQKGYGMSFFRKKTPLWSADQNLMDMIPVRKIDSAQDKESLNAVLLIPKFRGKLGSRWIQPRLNPDRAYFKLHLDPMGSRIWDQINASDPLADIYYLFTQWYPQESDLLDRFVRFVQNLVREDFIELRLPCSEPLSIIPGLDSKECRDEIN